MKLFLTLFCLLSILSSRAQETATHIDTTLHAQDTTQSAEIDNDKTFTKVEIEASYPGGNPAWLRFLVKNLRYPDKAQMHNIMGDVMVQFIVDKDGNVSDIEAISGPDQGGLREEAVRMIKLSGKWTPGMQNGRQVRSYKRQMIRFKMERG